MGPTALLPLRRKAYLGFFAPKIRRLRPGVNPRTWVPKASTLPLDHRSRLYKFYYLTFFFSFLDKFASKLWLWTPPHLSACLAPYKDWTVVWKNCPGIWGWKTTSTEMCKHILTLVKMGKTTCISAHIPKTTDQILIRVREYLMQELQVTNKTARLLKLCRHGQAITPFFCTFHVHMSLSRG
jgi:hypothetical protein